MTVLDDFEQVMAFALSHRLEGEVIEDEEIGFGDLGEAPDQGSVTAGDAQTVEQPGNAFIANGETLATSLVAESTGEPGFAGAGWSREVQVVTSADPVAGDEGSHQRAFETATVFVVDVFDTGWLAEAGELQETVQSAVLTLGDFAIEQQGEALFKGQRLEIRLFELFRESRGHPAEAQVAELIKSLIEQHRRDSFFVFALV